MATIAQKKPSEKEPVSFRLKHRIYQLGCILTLSYMFNCTRAEELLVYPEICWMMAFFHLLISRGIPRFSENRFIKNYKLMEDASLLFYYCVKSYMFIIIWSSEFSHYKTIDSFFDINNIASPLVNLYLSMGVCHYVAQILTITIPPYSKDDDLFTFHHFITILVIFVSYQSNYSYATVLILFYHDFSDTFLYLTRILKTLKSNLIVISFPLFYIFFIAGRLILFPITVISASYLTIHHISITRSFWIHIFPIPICFCIFLLQCFWEKSIRTIILKYLDKKHK